jgi:gliding motility-associated lipoprotein GldD
MTRFLLLISVLIMAATGCQEAPGTPKPRAYPRIEFPAKEYKEYNVEGCPFSFQYPVYAEIRDKDQSCWFDLYMPEFEARVHCSYVAIKNKEEYNDLVRDAFVIAYKINERANYMEEMRIRNPQGIGGLSLQWTGPAASPVHFFLTDTTSHFFKAALYFDSKVQPDSLAPIVSFIQKDIDQMISTFTWH